MDEPAVQGKIRGYQNYREYIEQAYEVKGRVTYPGRSANTLI